MFVLFSLLDVMLDMSTIHQIPFHLQRILSDRNLSCIDVLNALSYYVGLECGFIKSQLDASSYSYTWYYSFDKRVFEDLQYEHFERKMSLKFVMNQSHEIVLECLDLGDIAMITAYEKSDKKVAHCHSIALPVSRFMPFKKLLRPLPSSFRNLKELSDLLKNEIFHPLRNEIYDRCSNTAPYLNKMPQQFLFAVYRHLDVNSKKNLSRTCKTQYANLLDMKKLRNQK